MILTVSNLFVSAATGFYLADFSNASDTLAGLFSARVGYTIDDGTNPLLDLGVFGSWTDLGGSTERMTVGAFAQIFLML